MGLVYFYREYFLEYLKLSFHNNNPQSLYYPIKYFLAIGGKRLRPIMVLMTADIIDKKKEKALPAAMCLEIFHNFTLAHDDIMDGAERRRGKETIHKKWNINTGILSGDAMLILAYQYLEKYTPLLFSQLIQLLTKTALQVCEGQQYDIDFEKQEKVNPEDYLKMITYKTAALLGCAFKMGVIISEGTETMSRHFYEFGKNLGIAFQLQDDYLDIFGDAASFGKEIGGDVLQNKKTFLYVMAQKKLSSQKSRELVELFKTKSQSPVKKIETAKKLFVESGSVEILKKEINNYTKKSLESIEKCKISNEKKEIFKTLANDLMSRET